MTSKKSNALKRQIYGTPLPLPCLQDPSLNQRPEQQQKTSSTSGSGTLVKAPSVVSWTLLDTLLTLLERIHNLFRDTNRHPRLDLIRAEFHPQGQSVWVTGTKNMETLFRQGFFGKGTLSRSEPTWKQRHTVGAQGNTCSQWMSSGNQRLINSRFLECSLYLCRRSILRGDHSTTATRTGTAEERKGVPISRTNNHHSHLNFIINTYHIYPFFCQV